MRLRPLLTAAAIATLPLAIPAQAVEIAGVTPPQTLKSGGGQELTLAGCAVREILWTEAYALALYLPQEEMPVDKILDPGTPKILRIYATYDGEVPNEVPDDWRAQLKPVLERDLMQTLKDYYKQLNSGDVASISYTPDQGSKLMINERVVEETKDNTLINALLSGFLGEDPISDNIKRLLLAGKC